MNKEFIKLGCKNIWLETWGKAWLHHIVLKNLMVALLPQIFVLVGSSR